MADVGDVGHPIVVGTGWMWTCKIIECRGGFHMP